MNCSTPLFRSAAGGVLDVDPFELVDRADYDRIHALARSIEGLTRKPHGSPTPVRRRWQAFRSTPLAALLGQGLLLCKHGGTIDKGFRHHGIADIGRLSRWLDGLLARKLPQASGSVTFGDLDHKLRVVAADVRTGALRDFGGLADRDLPVAPAVAASACYPLFFRPVRIGDGVYVDGGLVSNLPAWVFDDEREEDPTFLPTFGFRLVGDPLASKETADPTSMVEFIQRLLQTLLAGESVRWKSGASTNTSPSTSLPTSRPCRSPRLAQRRLPSSGRERFPWNDISRGA